jgi:hypothetical protein
VARQQGRGQQQEMHVSAAAALENRVAVQWWRIGQMCASARQLKGVWRSTEQLKGV